MSLDLKKLEKARSLANGVIQARCPACANNDSDKAGEHLRVYPDGRFGCCVHPKDREHRRKIHALAGEKSRRITQARVQMATRSPQPLQSITASLSDFTGTLRTAFYESEQTAENSASEVRTLRTPDFEPEANGHQVEEEIRTLRTGILSSHIYSKEDIIHTNIGTHVCKDKESGVLSVLSEKLPYYTMGGTLVIPFNSPERYHWWKGGQSVAATRREMLAQVA